MIASIDAIREEGCDFLHLTLSGEADIMFITDTIPRLEAAAGPRFGYLEIDASGIQPRIDVETMQQKTTLPPMLSAIQEDILTEMSTATNEEDLEHLQSELVEFWRNLRNAGLLEEEG